MSGRSSALEDPSPACDARSIFGGHRRSGVGAPDDGRRERLCDPAGDLGDLLQGERSVSAYVVYEPARPGDKHVVLADELRLLGDT